MDRSRLIVTVVLALVGLVWIGQGLGFVPGSFMTGDRFWAVAGLALVATALISAAWPRLRHR